VEIFNREDCCGEQTKNVEVRIANELPTSANQTFSGGSLLGHFAGPASDGQHIIISGPTLSGRYVIVQMDNGMGAFLNLREVKAFGEEGCTIEQATDYFGWDLEGGSKIKVTANIQECADYSASTPGSRFWTWSKTTKKCYPKSSKAGRQEAGIEVVSGNNRCANSGCGNDWEPYDDHCYYWSNNTKTWDEAEAFCQEENGHLASITSNAINQYVVEGMNSRGLRNTWMGGTDIDEEGTWKWRDGSPFIFTFWHSGEPNNQGGNQHCLNQWKHPLSIGQGIKWDDQRCSDSLTFLCSKKKSAGCVTEKNIDYLGNDIAVGVTESHQECANWCLTMEISNGNFWTWDPRDKGCYIKSSSSGRKHHSVTISGNRECGVARSRDP